MQLVEVNSSKLIKAFHQVPKPIYKNDPHYIAHIKQDIDKIFVQKGLKGDLWQELSTALRARNMGVKTVPLEKLDRLTRKNHQGVVAFLSPITFDNLEDVVTSAFEKGEVPLVMILDHLTDVRNFGAIVRTAECAGVHAIVVPELERFQVSPAPVRLELNLSAWMWHPPLRGEF